MAQRIKFQLKDLSGAMISSSGGAVHVATAGSPAKAAITDKNGVAATNPVVLTAGGAEFYVADNVASVDLYIQAPGGQFAVKTGVVPANYSYPVDTSERYQVYKIPFSIADCVAATEKDSGFDLPANAQVLPLLGGASILVTTLETTGAKTIDVGTGEAHPVETGGNADGLLVGVSTAAAGQVVGVNGALYASNAPYLTSAYAAKSITYTLVTASVTAAGFAILPVILNA